MFALVLMISTVGAVPIILLAVIILAKLIKFKLVKVNVVPRPVIGAFTFNVPTAKLMAGAVRDVLLFKVNIPPASIILAPINVVPLGVSSVSARGVPSLLTFPLSVILPLFEVSVMVGAASVTGVP